MYVESKIGARNQRCQECFEELQNKQFFVVQTEMKSVKRAWRLCPTCTLCVVETFVDERTRDFVQDTAAEQSINSLG